LYNVRNTADFTGGARTDYPSGAHELSGVHVAQSLVFCVVFCPFVMFNLTIV